MEGSYSNFVLIMFPWFQAP